MPLPAPSPLPNYSPPITEASALPPLVAAMRSRILVACRSGDIEALRVPIDRNEVRPLFERGGRRDPGADPIATLKRLSYDGGGRETLLLLRNVLTQACVRETRRQGASRTIMYIWPAFAIDPPPQPAPDDTQVMLSCIRFDDLRRTASDGALRFTRVGIGSDGVWHYFWGDA